MMCTHSSFSDSLDGDCSRSVATDFAFVVSDATMVAVTIVVTGGNFKKRGRQNDTNSVGAYGCCSVCSNL